MSLPQINYRFQTFGIFSKTFLMYAISLPGIYEWIAIVVVIGVAWLAISTVIHIARKPQMEINHKLFWVFIVVLAPILGPIAYYVFYNNISGKP